MAHFMKILAALLFAVMLTAAPGAAYARGGGHGGGGHGGGGHGGGHGGGGHFHGGHFHGGHFRGGFGWGWGWGWPYYYSGYYGDDCRWVRLRVWRGDHWSYRRVWRCWY